MVDGKTPFFAERPMDVYEKILEGKYKMPPHCSGHLENIIHLLLRPNQGKRLGNGKGGVEAINDHRFFAGYTYISARVPIKIENNEDNAPTLNKEQIAAINQINKDKFFHPWLLFGITGSGKTEVYLNLIFLRIQTIIEIF